MRPGVPNVGEWRVGEAIKECPVPPLRAYTMEHVPSADRTKLQHELQTTIDEIVHSGGEMIALTSGPRASYVSILWHQLSPPATRDGQEFVVPVLGLVVQSLDGMKHRPPVYLDTIAMFAAYNRPAVVDPAVQPLIDRLVAYLPELVTQEDHVKHVWVLTILGRISAAQTLGYQERDRFHATIRAAVTPGTPSPSPYERLQAAHAAAALATVCPDLLEELLGNTGWERLLQGLEGTQLAHCSAEQAAALLIIGAGGIEPHPTTGHWQLKSSSGTPTAVPERRKVRV